MKLIQMTDFVLEYDEKRVGMRDYCNLIVNYATFLKQPLQTNMFVVMDETNDPMENPDIYSEESEELEYYRNKYLKQSESVLFKGFKLSSIGMMHVKNKNIFIGLGFENGIFQTVEDLVNYPNWPKYEEIELTEIAKKMIKP